MAERPRSVALFAVGILATVVAAGVALYYVAASLYPSIFVGTVWFNVLLTFGFGLLAILGIERLVKHLIGSRPGHRWSGVILSAFRFIAYAALAFAVLVSANVNSIALLTGGTFAGLVLGLAGSTALSNVISGIVILSTLPMRPGDRVTISTWQYGLSIPAYPPKFYSQDFLVPGYTGVVRNLGIVYSSIKLDEGPIIQIPNGILLQAAILTHEDSERWVRTRFEVPATLEVRSLMERVRKQIAATPWVADPESVRVLVNHASTTAYVLSVDALCRGSKEEPPRSAFLLEIAEAVRATAAAPAPSAPPPAPPKSERSPS